MEKKKLRERTCCFTGHRALPNEQIGEIETRTEAVVCTLIKEKQVCYFGVGGAAGYDTLAAELLFRLRKTRYPHIKIILVVPFDGFTRAWTEEQRVHYNQLLGHYNKVVCAAACAGREAYLRGTGVWWMHLLYGQIQRDGLYHGVCPVSKSKSI